MLQIIRVDTLDNQTLDIEFSNGNLILLDINPLLCRDDAYTALSREKLLPRPLTDGNRIYWQDGPILGLEEIFILLGSQEGNKIKEDIKNETKK